MAADAPTTAPSPAVLMTLLAVLAVSSVTYWVLIRRATSHRKWVALSSWARAAGYRFQPRALLQVPEPFGSLPDPKPRARICLSNGRTTLLQIQGVAAGQGMAARALQTLHTLHAVHTEQSERAERGAAASDGASAVVLDPPPATTPSGEPQWNVLIRRLEVEWTPTGLRPAGEGANSVIDLFALRPFPRLDGAQRFVAHGADAASTKALAAASVKALLPPDVGLLLHGHCLVLDFSTRPFDAIEFDRMRVLVDQIAAHLPAPPGARG